VGASTGNFELTVEPDYGQFYMRRSGSDAWDSADVPSLGGERHLWSNGVFVYVGTVRKYGTTAVRVEVLDSAPRSPPGRNWQHVVETSLDAGGDLEIFDWDGRDPVATIPIPRDPVRLRVCWSGLSEANHFEGLDEEGNSNENLLMQLWKQEAGDPAVLRWWPPLELPAASDRSIDGRRQFEGLEVVMEAFGRMELVARCDYPYPSLPGSTQGHSSVNALFRDPRDGSLWVDGYDVRRTMREVTESEAAELFPQA
jgi:hypothetical protein